MSSVRYVGSAEIREALAGSPAGTRIDSRAELLEWLSRHRDERGWATYVVALDGALVLAARRSEHVACAGGQDVLAAGELRFDAAGAVTWVSNQSAGYCPPESCWEHVAAALDRADVSRPHAFTFLARFRRCPRCGEKNLVKDEWYVCTFCDADLPTAWNFAPAEAPE
jgi:hypothetical protein